jgi:hypothetical protein
MRVLIMLASLVVAIPAWAGSPTLTCQDSGNMRHCWNERGETRR